MTTATRPAIVPAMPLLDVPARTDEDPRTVPTVPLAAPGPDRTVPAQDPGPTPDRTGPVPAVSREQDRPTEDRTGPPEDRAGDRTGPVPSEDRPTGGPTGDRTNSDPDQDRTTEDPTAPPEDRREDHLGTDRNSKAGQIRAVFDAIYDPTTEQINGWLEEHGVTATPRYVRRIVREERERRQLGETGETPALSADVLARMDAERAIDTRIDPAPEPTPTPPAKSAPVEPAALGEQQQGTAELAARVRDSRARLPLQTDPALFEAWSEDEIRAERDLVEWERATDREIRRSQKAAQLANSQREQATAEAIAKSESNDARWLERAVSARRRLTSPDAKLAQLHRRSEWSSRALVGVVILGMIWSGINVQHNLVPNGDMANPLYWISYGIEAMISVPLIVIMVAATTAARWGRELSRRAVVPVELALLSITVGLNAGPHFASGNLATIAENAIAPVMVGVVIWLHAWVSSHYATLIMGSEESHRTERDR